MGKTAVNLEENFAGASIKIFFFLRNLYFKSNCWISGFCPPSSTTSQELDLFLSSGGKMLMTGVVLYGLTRSSTLDNKSVDPIEQSLSSESNRSSTS